METYEIKKTNRKRAKTNYILLVPCECFLEGNYPIKPYVLNSGGNYTYDIFEKYFYKTLKHDVLPFNYFMERVNEDYSAMIGSPHFSPSYFVEDLVQAGVIDYKYINSIVVMLGYNFNLYPMDRRFANQLSYKILNPMLRMYNLQPDRIKFIDECYNPDWKDFKKFSKLEYHLVESDKFDINRLMTFVHKYNNYSTKGYVNNSDINQVSL